MKITWLSVGTSPPSRSARGHFAFSMVLALTMCAGIAASAADEAPLVLTSEHIGMTGDEIAEQASAASATETASAASAPSAVPAGEAAASVEDLRSAADAAQALSASAAQTLAEAEAAVAAAEAAEAAEASRADAEPESEWRSEPGDDAAANEAKSGVSSHESCIESSIRGGASYAESSRVCGALFP
jgi:hypothetical protein